MFGSIISDINGSKHEPLPNHCRASSRVLYRWRNLHLEHAKVCREALARCFRMARRKTTQEGRMRIRILQILEIVFERIETWSGKARERCAVCPDCGANRYTGKPCVKY